MLQNVGFSLLIIGVLIPLAALGVLGLAVVVVVHETAEVLVILNAMRAARARTLPGLTVAPTGNACHHVTVETARPPDDPCCAPRPRTGHTPLRHEIAARGAGGCACCSPERSGAADQPRG
jgi:cation-transporting ATPase G